MDEPQVQTEDHHPFEQFKTAMRKLVSISKAELDAKIKAHNQQKPKRRAGRKPTRRKAD